MVFYFVAAIVVLVDQISKMLIRANLGINENLTLWGIPLTHIENSGMAGGMLQGYGRLFGIVAILFIAGVIYARRSGGLKGKMNDLGLAFLAGGAAGNGIDRLLFGQVTDFLASRPGGGVLNIADHAIEIGVLFLISNALFQLLKGWKDKRCSTGS